MSKTKEFEPMLSGTCTNIEKLSFPVLASPKLDGIRAYVRGGVVYSRNGKPVPNANVQAMFGRLAYEGFDGELIAGDPTAENCFRYTDSIVMSRDKPAADVRFYVFDVVPDSLPSHPFRLRLAQLEGRKARATERIIVVPHVLARGPSALAALEEQNLSKGYEGLMLRDPEGPYKFGRSTEREGWLLKLKRFEDAEARIVSCVEEQANMNEATKDKFGRTERSTHKANKVGKGVLGALVVTALNGVYKGKTFNVGTGFKASERADLWATRELLPGRVIKFKYFPTGSKDLPRFPTFLGFRND